MSYLFIIYFEWQDNWLLNEQVSVETIEELLNMSLVDVRCRDVLAAHVTLRELVDAGPESLPVAIDRFHLLAGGLEDAVVH